MASMRESIQNNGKASVEVIPLTGPNVEHVKQRSSTKLPS